MTRTRTFIGLGIALGIAGLVTTSAVHAQAGRGRGFGRPGFARMGPGGPGGPGGMMAGLRGLDLTEAQRDQARAVVEQYRPQFEQVGTQARDAHAALRTAVTADGFDEGAIRAAHVAVAAADVEIAVLQARVHADVMNLLTPEQRQKAAELKAERAERMHERQQRMQERRQQRQNR